MLASFALWTIQVPAVQAPAQPVPSIELPPGPAARAFAGVVSTTVPAALGTVAAQGLNADTWRKGEAWMAWAEAVRGEAHVPHPQALRRAELAQIALAQGRWDDAWEHFAATGAEPSVCAALVPSFLPGVPTGLAVHVRDAQLPQIFVVGSGGIVGELPDGVLLRPAVPPPALPAAELQLGRTWIERRSMRLNGLRIGEATLAMQVSLESDGIQIDFEHQAGGKARVRVWLPELADFEVRVAYIDWMRQDEVGKELEVIIAPGDETHTLFGRFRPRSITWPTNLPQAAARGLVENGLALVYPGSAPDADMFRAAGPAFALVLGLPVVSAPSPRSDFVGVQIDLGDPALARRKFLGIF